MKMRVDAISDGEIVLAFLPALCLAVGFYWGFVTRDGD